MSDAQWEVFKRPHDYPQFHRPSFLLMIRAPIYFVMTTLDVPDFLAAERGQ